MNNLAPMATILTQAVTSGLTTGAPTAPAPQGGA